MTLTVFFTFFQIMQQQDVDNTHIDFAMQLSLISLTFDDLARNMLNLGQC